MDAFRGHFLKNQDKDELPVLQEKNIFLSLFFIIVLFFSYNAFYGSSAIHLIRWEENRDPKVRLENGWISKQMI